MLSEHPCCTLSRILGENIGLSSSRTRFWKDYEDGDEDKYRGQLMAACGVLEVINYRMEIIRHYLTS
jgi:hypothetical protein